ncbi:MAG: hypothetical protein N2B06_08320 [Clostridium sp.]
MITTITTIITFISVAVSFLMPIYLSYKYHIDSNKVSADGPTAIFVASQLSPHLITFIFALISMVGIIYLIFTRKATK